MTKLRKTLMAAGVLLLSSVAFVGCSDDDKYGHIDGNTLGTTNVIGITAYTTSVKLHWSITPTKNVESYLYQIFQGTRENMGSLVTEQTFGNKVYESVFEGLQPNTKYVVVSQCIPAKGSKFTKADVAYFEFWTAPVMTITSASAVVTESTDDEGNPIYSAALTINWAENLDKQQIAGIQIYIEDEDENVLVANQLVSGVTGNTVSIKVPGVSPGTQYYISLLPNPSQYSFYTTATAEWSDEYPFTMPAAQ